MKSLLLTHWRHCSLQNKNMGGVYPSQPGKVVQMTWASPLMCDSSSLSAYLSVGWKAVDILCLMSSSLHSCWKNSEANRGSLSETIYAGKPCLAKISLRKKFNLSNCEFMRSMLDYCPLISLIRFKDELSKAQTSRDMQKLVCVYFSSGGRSFDRHPAEAIAT